MGYYFRQMIGREGAKERCRLQIEDLEGVMIVETRMGLAGRELTTSFQHVFNPIGVIIQPSDISFGIQRAIDFRENGDLVEHRLMKLGAPYQLSIPSCNAPIEVMHYERSGRNVWVCTAPPVPRNLRNSVRNEIEAQVIAKWGAVTGTISLQKEPHAVYQILPEQAGEKAQMQQAQPANDKCTACGSVGAYLGVFSCECVNPGCMHFSERRKEEMRGIV